MLLSISAKCKHTIIPREVLFQSPRAEKLTGYHTTFLLSYTETRWEGVSIVVMEKYQVDEPYTKDAIKVLQPPADPGFLERLGNMVSPSSVKSTTGKALS
jgi:hypothetical protein